MFVPIFKKTLIAKVVSKITGSKKLEVVNTNTKIAIKQAAIKKYGISLTTVPNKLVDISALPPTAYSKP